MKNDFNIQDGVLRAYLGTDEIVQIPENVNEIWYHAFNGKTFIKKIIIPESVTKIAHNAFSGCTGLADEQGLVILQNKVFGYYGNSSDITIPFGTVSIVQEAFSKSHIKSVLIPETVKEIAQRAFFNCSHLNRLILSEGIERIDGGAFMWCSKLESLSVPIRY